MHLSAVRCVCVELLNGLDISLHTNKQIRKQKQREAFLPGLVTAVFLVLSKLCSRQTRPLAQSLLNSKMTPRLPGQAHSSGVGADTSVRCRGLESSRQFGWQGDMEAGSGALGLGSAELV